MKITIVYDNTNFIPDLEADWGFAAMVEFVDRTLLFDTGGSGAVLMKNLSGLGFASRTIHDVFISHAHFDHIGGLSAVLDNFPGVTAWLPKSFRGVKRAHRVVSVDEPMTLYPGVHSTGELNDIEQSLCIETTCGVVVLCGCSHPPLEDILSAASQFGPVHGIIGGFHDTPPEAFKDLNLICATHCTRHKHQIRTMFPHGFIQGGIGKTLTFELRS